MDELKIHDHWRVEVSTSGDSIVAIEPGMLSGKELTQKDENTIRNCAEHLLSFVGNTGVNYDDKSAGLLEECKKHKARILELCAEREERLIQEKDELLKRLEFMSKNFEDQVKKEIDRQRKKLGGRL